SRSASFSRRRAAAPRAPIFSRTWARAALPRSRGEPPAARAVGAQWERALARPARAAGRRATVARAARAARTARAASRQRPVAYRRAALREALREAPRPEGKPAPAARRAADRRQAGVPTAARAAATP